MLAELNVNEQIITDFMKIRTAKRSPLTQTALDGIKREADKAGITLEDALRVCIERAGKDLRQIGIRTKAALNNPQVAVCQRLMILTTKNMLEVHCDPNSYRAA